MVFPEYRTNNRRRQTSGKKVFDVAMLCIHVIYLLNIAFAFLFMVNLSATQVGGES
jgi:hypothetical protein